MFRGIIKFHCTECGCNFNAPDYEYAATVYSMPQPCPKCESWKTRPANLLGKLQEETYRRIWERMENE